MKKIFLNRHKLSASRNKTIAGFFLLLFLVAGLSLKAQSTANYAFATNTTSSLAADANANAIDMATGTTQIIGPGLDATASAVTNIGFDFYLMGNRFTQFSVQEDGIMQLGSTMVSTNAYTITSGTLAAPRLSAFNADLRTGTTTGKVHFRVVGSSPNRTLVVEFKDMQVFYTVTAAAGTSTWQIRLYETTGIVEYVYGAMSTSVLPTTIANSAASIGFYTGSATNSFASILFASNANSTTSPYAANPAFAAPGAITSLDSAADGSRRAYLFTPPAPVAPTTLTFSAIGSASTTVNWVDNSTNEFGFTITRATDAAFTTAVVTTVVPSTTSAGTGTSYLSSQTGLVNSTLYFYRIQAVTEGAVSTGITGSQATLASATITAGLGGLWSSPVTWAGGILPSSVDSVVVPTGVTVVVDTAVTARNLDITGTVQWNGSGSDMTLTGNLTVNVGGRFLQHTTAGTGQTVFIGGDFTNNGFVNAAYPSSVVRFNGSGSTLGGSGTFLGDGTNGFIRQLTFANLGSNAITTTQNLIATNGLSHLAGSLNTNGKLTLDSTAQVFGQPTVNSGVQSIAVTNAGTLYTVAPVVFGQTVVQYANALVTAVGTRYVNGNNVYLCTALAPFNATPPTSTDLQATFATSGPTLLFIGTLGTLGTNIPFNTALVTATQYFHGDNVYQSLVTTAVASAANYPVHTSGVVNNFLYLGTVAKASVVYDATSQTVRSLTLTQNGTGFTTAPAVAFSVGVASGTGSGAAATAVVNQSISGLGTGVTFQKSGGAATITGGLTINSDQGAAALALVNSAPASVREQSASGVGNVFITNGGLNYTVAPTVGFSLPTGINLVTSAGSGYTTAPTITVTGGTLVSGTALASASFTITVNNGTVQSVYLTGTATYSTLPTLAFSAGNATLAFPAGCLPVATANIGTNGQLTSFSITNAGYGYNASPTVGLLGGTFTTAASTPNARLGLYNFTTNWFAPAAAPIVQGEDAAIPANRKINTLSIAGNGLGMNITDDLTLFGVTPLTLVASGNGTGNILDLGGKNLICTLSTYAGVGSTTGATNTFIRNGSMVLTTRGGSATYNYPYSGTVTVATGTTPTAVTTGSNATRITVSPTLTASGTVDSGALTGNRGYRIVLNSGSVYGTNPTVGLGYTAADGILATNPTVFIAQATALTGPWTIRSTTTGTSALTVPGTRTTATTAPGPIVMTGDDYFAFASTLGAYVSAATGNWESTATWVGGVVPPDANANVLIMNGHNVTTTATGNLAKSVTINLGGTLTVGPSSALTVAEVGRNNSSLSFAGTLTVTGGTLNINGNLEALAGSTFNQSGGNINVDGNNAADAATSVASGVSIVQLNSQFINWTGGTLTIVDPHANTSASNSFAYNNSTANVNVTAGHTLRFGDGISTDTGGNATNGFRMDTFTGSSRISFFNLEVNGGVGTNRFVTTRYTIGINGNLNINANGELRDNALILHITGNVVNNGTLTSTGTLSFATFLGGTAGAVATAQTISGSGVYRNSTTLPTANFTGLTINNTSVAGVTFSDANSLLSGTNSGTVSSQLTFTNGIINTGANTFVLGISASTVGSLSYTAGGFGSGSTFGRWFGTTGSGTSITAGSNPTFGAGSYPFVDSGFAANHFHRATAALTTGGRMNVTFTAGAGTAALAASVTENSLTFDRKTNSNWVVALSNGYAATATTNVAVLGANSFSTTTATARLLLNEALVGTHAAGSNLPMAQRTAIPFANLATTYTIGSVAADLSIQTAQSGNWDSPSTWLAGVVPTACAPVFILNGHNVTTATTITAGSVTINGGGTLTVNTSTDLTVGCTNRNNTLTNNGTLTVNDGVLTINGNLVVGPVATFNQSGGSIIVDGNDNGTVATSVAAATPLVRFNSHLGAVTAGTITIVDSPAPSGAAPSFSISTPLAPFKWNVAHTTNFGNGISTDASANANGFELDCWVGSFPSFIGSVVVNGGANTNRWFTTATATANGSFINGNLTINSGSELRGGSTAVLYIGGNIVNNGTLTTQTTPIAFQTITAGFFASPTSAQTVSGSGTFRNLLVAPTHQFTSLTMSNANGVTFASNNISVSGGLTVNTGAVINFASGKNLTLGGIVTVTAPATLTFENNANLIQPNTGTNVGSIIVRRNTAMQRLAYTYWGSPVAGQNLLAFSPLTTTTPISRFYSYSEPTGAFVSITTPGATNFVAGQGYSVRAPNTFADAPAAAQTFVGTFTGIPNNGTITVAGTKATTGYNLIGNPYPCTINALGANGFITVNPSTLYFWTKTLLGAAVSSNYASLTSLTGTAAAAGGAAPNGIIQVGQGFFSSVPPTVGASSLVFNNAMKVANNADQFFRTTTTTTSTFEKHLIKFNLTTPTANFNQIAVGYMTGATNGVDAGIDGLVFGGGNPTMISSLINGADYVIQGKAVAFNVADEVALGFRAENAGSYTITTADKEGIFAANQDFYIKDNLTGTTHNIKQSPYTFVSNAGTFNSRFKLVYQTVLNVVTPTLESGMVVFVKNENINIKSTVAMSAVKVFDLAGRLIFEKSGINTNNIELNELRTAHQVLLVQVTAEGKTATKKIVY